MIEERRIRRSRAQVKAKRFGMVLERHELLGHVLHARGRTKRKRADHEKLAKFGLLQTPKSSGQQSTAAQVGNGAGHPASGEDLSDAQVEQRIAERIAARARRDFAASDKIRDELLQAGVILEDTKAGTRWKRK